MRGLVISDLHLFSRRSDGAALWADLCNELRHAGTLVLNGDIFDFRWSGLPDEEATIAAALQWVGNLVNQSRWESIHYIFGNHDCLAAFRDRLKEFAADHPKLQCYDERLRLGRSLFLHGDCANRKMDNQALRQYRQRWSRDQARGPLRKALYDGADVVGLSRGFHTMYFPHRRSVGRIAHHLDHVMPPWRDEIADCYFGHTHRPFADFLFEGVRFHNTGSGIRGMGFQPLTFDLERDEN